MTTRIPRARDDEWGEKGTWLAVTAGGKRSAVICCPQCGVPGSISGTHEIDEHGVVTPSLHCSPGTCGWHVMGVLDGWEP